MTIFKKSRKSYIGWIRENPEITLVMIFVIFNKNDSLRLKMKCSGGPWMPAKTQSNFGGTDSREQI